MAREIKGKSKDTPEKRMEVFANEYITDFNGTRAYKAAGYSEKGAAAGASRLLINVKVKALISKLVEQRCDELAITKSRVLRELALMGFANMHDYVTINSEGQADIDLSALTRDKAAAIQEITVDTTGGTGDGERRQVLRTKFKLSDKRGSLELLGNNLKLFSEKHEITGAEGAPLAISIKLVKSNE